MAKVNRTLIIRHLPEELGEEEQKDLLENFGATHIRSMGHKGRMKHVAFATFADDEAATIALKRFYMLNYFVVLLIVALLSLFERMNVFLLGALVF